MGRMDRITRVKRNLRALYILAALVTIIGVVLGIGSTYLPEEAGVSDRDLGDLSGTGRITVIYAFILLGIALQVRALLRLTKRDSQDP